MSRLPRASPERKAICASACRSCHTNWQRSTYVDAGAIDYSKYPRPSAVNGLVLQHENACSSASSSAKTTTLDRRYEDIKRSLPPAVVRAWLRIAEMRVIERNNFAFESVASSMKVHVTCPRPPDLPYLSRHQTCPSTEHLSRSAPYAEPPPPAQPT